MNYCFQCGRELASGAKFCTYCGASQPQSAEQPSDATPCDTPDACAPVIGAPLTEPAWQQPAGTATAFAGEHPAVNYAAPQPAAAPAYKPSRSQRSPRHNGLAVAGFVLSLVGLTFFWMPTLGPTLMLAGVALCLSVAGFIVGLVKKRSWGLAVAGLIISLVALIANLAVLYFS